MTTEMRKDGYDDGYDGYGNFEQLGHTLCDMSYIFNKCNEQMLPDVYLSIDLGMKKNLYKEEYKKIIITLDRYREGVEIDVDKFLEKMVTVKTSLKALRRKFKFLINELESEDSSDIKEENKYR
ncbi:MAG: hypothetical protein ACLPWD_06590 [Methanobacterium sp.]